jgi:hypothetical protein
MPVTSRSLTSENRTMKIIRLLMLIGVAFAFAAPAAAQPPAAVVEDISGSQSGVGFMDYVEPGKVIRLGPSDSMVLSYLKSCVREKITGGTVTVGGERSDVQAGTVERTTVECDAGKMMLTSQQAKQTASYILRDVGSSVHSLPQLQFTLYGASPLVEVNRGGELVIERLDQSGERYELTVNSTPHGAFYDFASGEKSLAPGGIYRASAGAKQVVFKIDTGAKTGRTPLAGRLIRLDPTS